MCLSSRKANFMKFHITHDTESIHATLYVCVRCTFTLIQKSLRHGSHFWDGAFTTRRSDSFFLLSQTRKLYILYLYSSLSLTLSSVLRCHYICNQYENSMLRYCFHSLLRSLPSCLRKNNQKFHFESENPTNSWIREILWEKYFRNSSLYNL